MPMNHQMQDLMKMLTLQVIILLFFEMTVINQIWILYIFWNDTKQTIIFFQLTGLHNPS